MCWGVRRVGNPGHSCSPPLGPADPLPAPSPHPPPRSAYPISFSTKCGAISLLTFSMTPTTLQPLSCSRAELSVRMGRSLSVLKPCRGGRQTPDSGPSLPQAPLPRQALLQLSGQ